MSKTGRARETVITFNEIDNTANVYTCNKKFRDHLDRNVKLRPDLGKCVHTEYSEHRYYKKDKVIKSKSYIIPKKWVKFIKVREMTPEDLERCLHRSNDMCRARKDIDNSKILSEEEIQKRVEDFRKQLNGE